MASDTQENVPIIKTKSSKVEFINRIAEIGEILLSGASSREAQNYAVSEWGVTLRQAQKYSSLYFADCERQIKKQSKYALSIHLQKLNRLYSRSFEINDFKTCLSILHEIAKIGGYHKNVKLEVTGEINHNHEHNINGDSTSENIISRLCGRLPDYEAAECRN